MNDFITRLKIELQAADREARQWAERRDALALALRAYGEEPAASIRPAVSTPAPAVSLHDYDIDLDGARNVLERCIRIAVATGRPVNCLQTAHYLITRGYATGKPRNLRSQIYNILKTSELFQKSGTGEFDYRPDGSEPMRTPPVPAVSEASPEQEQNSGDARQDNQSEAFNSVTPDDCDPDDMAL